MKGIDEARHIPEPATVQAVLDKRKFEKMELSPRFSPTNAFGEKELEAALCDADTEAMMIKDYDEVPRK